MSMARYQNAAEQRRAGGLMVLPLLLLFTLAFVALGYVAYALWPRWPEPPVAADAPALPIVVGGVLFNVPPQAMRVAVQRRAGMQERIDLVYEWPSLTPPHAAAPASINGIEERVFVTITAAAGALAPLDRLKSIYPRYTASETVAAPDGLAVFAFRDGTPYQAEDLAFDADAPEKFLARCARSGRALVPATCLAERRIGGADITVRFPRDWLRDWRNVEAGIDRLIGQVQMRGSSG
jgi:hypothetical protein